MTKKRNQFNKIFKSPLILIIIVTLLLYGFYFLYKYYEASHTSDTLEKNISTKPVVFYVNGVEITKENSKNNFAELKKIETNSIFEAIYNDDHQQLDALLKTNIDLEKKNKFGHTALYTASFNKKIYAVEQLIKNGANMYVMDNQNSYTAFTWAVSDCYTINNTYLDIVKIFLKHGVNVNHQYKKSETALSIAASGCRSFELVELLLDHGADPNLKDWSNQATKYKLFTTCKKDENYKKMVNLIDNHKFDESKYPTLNSAKMKPVF